MMKTLADPLRLKIIDLLTMQPLCVSEMAESLDAEMANISHHLRVLRQAKLIEHQRRGKYLIYRICEGVHQQGYLDLGCCRLELPRARP